ncbi:hypothetical protein NP493_537g01018 [Ridgeia piscesae]|uniref:Uncharacterized protein n=1 Tax=Ridgeia piscesae TaxID=27915 RepID=A0AAD9KWH9_RIDPI|nr:hypothetical protein NP493_537g01018 [Ridgeia piscesae]
MNVKELRAAFESVGYSLGTRDLKRIVKKYCAKRNHLNLDDFVYCVTKVTTTQDTERKTANDGPANDAWGMSYV